MKLTWFPYTLHFKYPFAVAGNRRLTTPIVIIKIEWKGIIAYGEASMPPYLGESHESVIAFLNKVNLKKFSPSNPLEEIINYVNSIELGNNAAKAAIDISLHDLYSKIASETLREYLKIPNKNSKSSYTIGIDALEVMANKTAEAKENGFKILKIKLNGFDDKINIEHVLSAYKAPFSVDVNQGWLSKEYALEMSYWLEEKGALFIEQPFRKEKIDDSEWLSARSKLPIIADESVRTLEDLMLYKDAFQGFNIKLMKSKGINEALKMIEMASLYKKKVVVGCMSESSCAATAAAVISPLADWVDLDAPYLITNDLFEGMKIVNGKIILKNIKGIGIKFLEDK